RGRKDCIVGIKRREMMQRLGVLAVAAGAADRALGSRSAAATTGWKPGDPIGYRRKTIPEFNIPTYQGDRYEALVPDTLDLAVRARWALNALTETTDPKADCEIYGGVLYYKNPAWMGHDFSDHGQPRYIETTPLLRIATGSDLNAHVDRVWVESALRMIGEDGLAWTPLVGRPWGTIGMESGTCVPEGIDISTSTEYLDATLNG